MVFIRTQEVCDVSLKFVDMFSGSDEIIYMVGEMCIENFRHHDKRLHSGMTHICHAGRTIIRNMCRCRNTRACKTRGPLTNTHSTIRGECETLAITNIPRHGTTKADS